MPLLLISFSGPAPGAEAAAPPATTADYRRADASYYAKGDVLRAEPSAVILPASALMPNGDTYAYTSKKRAPAVIYLETPVDWIEPITPPDMPASLNIPPEAMQIREPQGDVQVALPEAPTAFAPVTDGMTLPNGAVIKTGPHATAAVLFGGVDSARLMPDSEAAVQQTVTPTSRSAEVDLTAGGVFSKVGTQVDVRGEYKVHTASADALAQGGDFVTITGPERTDVWISQGKVAVLAPDGKISGTATAYGTGPLRLLRFPQTAGATTPPEDVLTSDAETLTKILDFIPGANRKVAALHDAQAKGTALTANELAYLHRLKQVPALIKLSLVQPPSPPTPAPPPAPAVAAVPAPPEPVTIYMRPNGVIHFEGATLTLPQLQEKLKALLAAKPDQSVIIKANPKAPYDQFQAVLDACKAIPVKEVAVAPPSPQPPLATSAAAATPATPVEPAVPPAPTPANPDVTVIPPTATANLKPLSVLVHRDGQVGFQGKRTDLAGFKVKVAAMVQATPQRALIIKAEPRVAYDKIKAVLDVCADAQVAHVTAPEPPAAPLPVTAETPPAPSSAPAPAPMASVAGESSNDKPVPGEIDLDNDGKLTLDGAPVTEDELKTRLAEIAKSKPKNPLVMYKQAKVTRSQWQHDVALCHEAGLRLRVKNATHAAAQATSGAPPPPTAETPPVPRPSAAEGGPVASVPETPAPHLSASPAPETAVPVEIELTPDGSISFLGEAVSESELKTRLDDVAKLNAREPVLVIKDEKVAHGQWQHVVDLCHAAGLKVRVKTMKSSDSAAAHATHPPEAIAAASEPDADVPTLHFAASPAPERLLPVEIDLDADGTMTLEGSRITGDNLTDRLATIAQTNPRQPIVLVKRGDVPREMSASIITIIHAANLKVTVHTAKSFAPEPPPVASAAVTPASEDSPAAAPEAAIPTNSRPELPSP